MAAPSEPNDKNPMQVNFRNTNFEVLRSTNAADAKASSPEPSVLKSCETSSWKSNVGFYNLFYSLWAYFMFRSQDRIQYKDLRINVLVIYIDTGNR